MGFLKKSVAFGVLHSTAQIQEITPPGVKFVGFVLTSQGI